MDRWQDVTSLSWVHLMLEFKHQKQWLLTFPTYPDLLIHWWTDNSSGTAMRNCQSWRVRRREEVDGGCHLEKLLETSPQLNSPGTKPDQQITWPSHTPWPGPYRTTNKLKLCHISNFLLALLWLLKLLKLLIFSAQPAVYDFVIFIRQCTVVSKYQTMCTVQFVEKISDVL